MPSSRIDGTPRNKIPADLTDAVYRTVHDFGVDRLAGLTGTPAGTIYNKANPNDTSHHRPTLADAMTWQALAGDFRILHAMGRALGHVCVKVPDLGHVPDEALVDLLLRIGKESGEFYKAIQDGFADRKFTRREFENIRREGIEAIAAIVEAIGRVEGSIDA